MADKPKAVSFVLLGGLFAAVVGPEIAYRFAGAVGDAPYAGAFFGAAGVQLFAFLVLAGLKIAPPDRKAPTGRPLSAFSVRQLSLGLVVAALGYACMSFLMTATPLQIVNVSLLGTEENARVIQWHVIAMFAPSFFTGALVSRFGVRQMILYGSLLYGLVCICAGRYQLLALFFRFSCWGWDGISYLLPAHPYCEHLPASRTWPGAGVSDLVIFSCVAIASLSAGVLHSAVGWDGLLLSCLVPLGLILLIWLAPRNRG